MVGLYGGDPLEYAAINEQGTDAVAPTTGDVLGAAFGQGLAANYFPRLMRAAGREAATTGVVGTDEYGRPVTIDPEPAVDPDALNAEFGIPGQLKFDKAVPRSVAQDLYDHKREQIRRQDVIDRAEPGILTGGVARFGANMVAGLLDPINLAIGFIPVAGEARVGALLAEAGSAAGRAAVRAAIGGAQGAVGMAALQPLEFALSRGEHEDYTMADALRSIALGTVLGGGMHAGIGAVLDRAGGKYRNPISRALDEAGPDVRHGLLEGALGQTIDGTRVDVGPALGLADAQRLKGGIAGDVERKLIAAGRPADEARAEGLLTQALWETHAAKFEGRKGTAEEMYLREGTGAADVVGGEQAPGATDPLDPFAREVAIDARIKALEVAHEGATTAAERRPLAAEIDRLWQERNALAAPGRELEQRQRTVDIGGHTLPLNPDGTVTLYHATPTPEAAAAIVEGKTLSSAGEPSVYLSTAREGTGYGDHVVAVNVDPARLRLDDEFPGGRADFAIDQPTTAVADAGLMPSGPLGSNPAERALTVTDILDPQTPARKARSRTTETIAGELMARGQAALRRLGVAAGRITGPSPRTDEIVSRAIADEIKQALQRSGHAGDWYTHKVDEAMQLAARLYPEIATDPNARTAFTAALAVTSQGETVASNVRLADQVYRRFRETGRFPEDVVAKNGAAMNTNFGKLNRLLDNIGPDETRQFLSRQFTVRELEQVSGENIGGENKDTRVYGSMILGPKIGQGFFQNLNGNFNPVTMDLWFMRAWGRLTGTLTGMSEDALAAQRTRLTNALHQAGEAVPDDAAGLKSRAEAIVKEHEQNFRKYRAEYNSGERSKTESVYAAERYLKGLDGINETPSSGAQRAWMRDRVNRARELLSREGVDITNADAQAAWWYPEKELYGKLGGRDAVEVNVDYATAWRDVARERGLSDADLSTGAAGTVRPLERGSGPAAAGDDAGAAGQVGTGDRQADGGEAGSRPLEEAPPQAPTELAQGARGKISLGDPVAGTRALITLFREADASTFLHETAHDWLERLARDAADPDAPAGLARDVATVRDWLGVKEGEPISTEAHEQFATAFEQYLREGRAPTAALQGVFDQLKAWLVQIYRTIAGLGTPINDDIRGVFDRMLATDEQMGRAAEPGAAPRIEATPPASAAAAPDIERAPAAGEPGGPVPSDTLREITAQAEQMERMRRPGEAAESPQTQAATELAAQAESHASATERAALCIMRG